MTVWLTHRTAAGTPGALSATMTDPGPAVASFTCPRCGMTSHNPTDVAESYCGNCHDWTGDPIRVSAVWIPDCPPHAYEPGETIGYPGKPCVHCGGFRLDPLHVV